MERINNYIHHNWNKIALIFSLFFAYILLPAFFEKYVGPVDLNSSIDPSWELTLNYAKLKNLIWGKEIIFTYGPLGYLSTKVGWGRSIYEFLLFDFFVFLNFFFIFYNKLKQGFNKKFTFFIGLFLSLFLPVYLGSGTAIILFAFYIFWIYESYKENKLINDLMLTILLLLMFFIKLNTGIISFVILFVLIFIKIYKKERSILFYSIFAIINILLIYFASILFNVEIISYIKYSFDIIGGFNDTMRLELNNNYEWYLAVILFLIIISSLTRSILVNKFKIDNLFISFLVVFPLFILYKQGFVRGDMGHISEFFLYFIFFLFVLDFYPFTLNLNKEIILIFCFIAFLGAKRKDDNFIDFNNKFNKVDYFKGITNFSEISGLNLFPNDNNIPTNIISKIGNSTVDIFPWNSHLLFENKLNYKPRPIVQSYSVYTKTLENLNFESYNNIQSAPKFVIYEYESIDNRYPLFDEAKLSIVFEKNYKIEDEFEIKGRKFLLLKAKNDFKPISFTKITTEEFKIENPINIENNIYYEVDLNNSFKGTIINLVKRQPELFLMLNTSDGKGNGFKTSLSLLKSGFYNKKFISNTDDFKQNLINNQTNNNEVKNIIVWPENKDNFRKNLKITEYKITQ